MDSLAKTVIKQYEFKMSENDLYSIKMQRICGKVAHASDKIFVREIFVSLEKKKKIVKKQFIVCDHVRKLKLISMILQRQ